VIIEAQTHVAKFNCRRFGIIVFGHRSFVLQRSCRFSSSQAEEVFGNGGRELQSAESSGFAGNFN
jgi:hypothetical protein